MLVKPPNFVSNSLAERVDASRVNPKGSCLDRPKIAAVHLKTAEDVEMFYGQSQTSAFSAAFVWTFQAAVAVIATVVAAVGHTVGSSDELNNIPSEDVSSMDINRLLDMRRSALESV